MRIDSLSIKGIMLGLGVLTVCVSAGFLIFLFAATGRGDLLFAALLYVAALCGIIGIAMYLFRAN